MPECKEKSTARLDTLRAFLTRQAGIFCQKHRRKADCQQTLAHGGVDGVVFDGREGVGAEGYAGFHRFSFRVGLKMGFQAVLSANQNTDTDNAQTSLGRCG